VTPNLAFALSAKGVRPLFGGAHTHWGHPAAVHSSPVLYVYGLLSPFPRLRAWALGLFLLALCPIRVNADLTRCHTALQGEASRLGVEIGKAIQSCAATVRRARGNGDRLFRAADQCERSLMKVYNVSAVPGRSAVDRFRVSLERLHPRKCSDEDLLAMGYFVPGINAPGTRGPCSEGGKACSRDSECTTTRSFCPGAMGDVIPRFIAEADTAARRSQLQALPDLGELIDAVVHLRPGGAGELGTDDCSRPPHSAPKSPSYRKRPNLCLLAPYLPCTSRTCSLSLDSNFTLAPLNLPIQLTDQTLPVEICAPNALVGPADVLQFSAVSQILAPPPLIARNPPITACVEIVSAQGWCDCSPKGQGAPFMPQLCVDHVIDAQGKDECGVSQQLLEQEIDCGCASVGGRPQPSPLPPCSVPGCNLCVQRGSDAPCHSGTRNGPLHEDWVGSSTPNECAARTMMRLSFLPPAFCRDSAGEVRGLCPAPGPADAQCGALGGTVCSDPRGSDGIACNGDDVTPWTLFPVRADLTTGTSKSRISDWVLSEGVCAGEGNLNCIEDRNCVAPATCAGPLFGCGSGPGANDCEVASEPGRGVACASLRAGSLGGWKLVGSVPRLDQPAGLRDGLMKVTLECE